MEQEQYQSYEQGEGFKPGHTVDVIPVLDRVNARLNAADQEALAQVRRNNQTRVENSKRAGEDLIALSKLSKTLTDALVERQKGINEDEKAEGVVEGYQQYMLGGLDTTQLNEGLQTAKQQELITIRKLRRVINIQTPPKVNYPSWLSSNITPKPTNKKCLCCTPRFKLLNTFLSPSIAHQIIFWSIKF